MGWEETTPQELKRPAASKPREDAVATLFSSVMRADTVSTRQDEVQMREAVARTAGAVREYLLQCSNGQSRREAMMARQIVQLLDDGVSPEKGSLGQLADRILSRCHFCAGKEHCPCPILCQRLVLQVRDLEQAPASGPTHH